MKMQLWLIGTGNEVMEWPMPSTGYITHIVSTIDDIIPDETSFIVADLDFDQSPMRISALSNLAATVVMVNDVTGSLQALPENFVRINAWPGFLNRTIVEAAANNAATKQLAAGLFKSAGRTMEWVPDVPGFLTARVITAMINEAWFALGEGISSREEIDTAMKLGTNYPRGPFEWGERIGLHRLYNLLKELEKEDRRYEPAPLLTATVLQQTQSV